MQPEIGMIVDKSKLGYVGRIPGSRDSNSWYTPEKYIISAKKVMGEISFDPFSSVEANNTVNATTFYTEADNALEMEWPPSESIWMNPPYSGGLSSKAVAALLANLHKAKHVIVLMNASTDTRWFRQLSESANRMCLTHGRIQFESPDGKKVSGNTKGQVFFYFGRRRVKFEREFQKYGLVTSL
jgi:phage N-6-adenine-methyltransferase